MKKSKKTAKINEVYGSSQNIKEQDIKKLQKTFEQFFGTTSEEIKERSKKLKRRFYITGVMLIVVTIITYSLIQNLKFVDF